MPLWRDMAIPGLLAFFQVVLQVAFHDRYGYFRHELYYRACSDHLDFWGYVDQPPFSIPLLWMGRKADLCVQADENDLPGDLAEGKVLHVRPAPDSCTYQKSEGTALGTSGRI